MIWAFVAGALVGTGALLLGRAATPSRAPLAAALAALYRETPPAPPVASGSLLGGIGRLAAPFTGRVRTPRVMADLSIVGQPVQVYVGRKVLFGLVGLAYIPILAWVLAINGVRLPVIVPVWVALLFGVAGFFLPDGALVRQARNRREELRAAFGSYLDIVVMLISADESVDGALDKASRASGGWVFAELRGALHECKRSGRPLWRGIDDLGIRYQLNELRDLANAVALTNRKGATMKESLVAKARTVRARTLAAEEAAAEKASAQMTFPLLVMLTAFLLYIGYPAVVKVLEL